MSWNFSCTSQDPGGHLTRESFQTMPGHSQALCGSGLVIQGIWVLGCWVLIGRGCWGWLCAIIVGHGSTRDAPGSQLHCYLCYCLADAWVHLGSQCPLSLPVQLLLYFLPNHLGWESQSDKRQDSEHTCSPWQKLPTLISAGPGLPYPAHTCFRAGISNQSVTKVVVKASTHPTSGSLGDCLNGQFYFDLLGHRCVFQPLEIKVSISALASWMITMQHEGFCH